MSTFRAPGSTRPRSKILSGVGLVLALLASLMAFSAAPVDATPRKGPTGSATSECVDGQWKITWTVNSNLRRADLKIGDVTSDPAFESFGGFANEVDPDDSTSGVAYYDGSTTGEVTLSVDWSWNFGPFSGEGTLVIDKNLGEDPCEPDPWEFKVKKQVTGATDAADPDHPFTINIACGEHIDQVTLKHNDEHTFVVPGAYENCTVNENAPDGGLDSGYHWASPAYHPNASISSDCKDCEVTVKNEVLEDPTWEFVVAKEIDGSEGIVEEGHDFEVSVSCEREGEDYTAGPEPFADGESVTFSGIPMDATPCTVTEAEPTGGLPSNYSWEAPQYEPSAQVNLEDECPTGDVQLLTRTAPAPCVTVVNSFSEDPPPPPPPPEDPDDPVVSASVDYVCDADATVEFSSADGESDFVVEVNGATVHTETLEGTNQVGITIEGTTSVIVRADGEVVINENVVFEACDDGGVGGIGDEAPEEEETVVEATEEEPTAAAPASLPRTGISASILAMVAALTMGFGATLRAASRRLR